MFSLPRDHGVPHVRAVPHRPSSRAAERVPSAEQRAGSRHLRADRRRRVTQDLSDREIRPRPSLRSGHMMTLFSWGNPRYFPRLPAPIRRYFDVDHDARVVADCHWQPQPWTRPTILALHGLNGSSDAHYMQGHRVESVRTRHERRPAESAQLRRHGTSVGRPVSFGSDARRRARDRGVDGGRRPHRRSSSPATRSAATSR